MASNPKAPLDATLLEPARAMRHDAAPAEQLVWRVLRDRQLGGYKFRRQVPLGAFVADFYCHAVKLVVELDGDTHAGRDASDEVRTILLHRMSYQVVSLDLLRVRAPFDYHAPHSNPLLEGEGTRRAPQ